jgi:hypothetical protein
MKTGCRCTQISSISSQAPVSRTYLHLRCLFDSTLSPLRCLHHPPLERQAQGIAGKWSVHRRHRELTVFGSKALGAEETARAAVHEYLNGPPSVAERLMFGAPVADKAALVKARKAATKDMLATWQGKWDKASHEDVDRQASLQQPTNPATLGS